MKFADAVQTLLALGQETRLTVFRLIVQKGDTGVYPSQIAEELGVPPATLSFHLKELHRAQLVSVERQSRKLLYRPRADSVDELMEFLLFNCCGGKGCAPKRTNKSRSK
jgi:DNA-binding transcriptional ArsR family regulator